MNKIIEIEPARLKLRQWRKGDLPGFARLNADPIVMKYYPSVLQPEESSAMASKLEALITEKGWGFWAVELKNGNEFIGFVGLHEPNYDLPVTPCVEIGWRLAQQYWGHGYATEAGKAALALAFGELNLTEVYSFTSVQNRKSQAVMERLGMYNTGGNFAHPMIPENNPLREHVLYKIDKQIWANHCG